MPTPRPGPPAPDGARRRPPPASQRCPTCGREDAVVFYPLRPPEPGEAERLVCTQCSPPPEEETKS